MSYKDIQKAAIMRKLKKTKYPITASWLSQEAFMYETGTAPRTRKLIRELVAEGNPIGSCQDGYFLIKSEKELQVYLNKLMSRSVALSSRILDTYNAFKKGGK